LNANAEVPINLSDPPRSLATGHKSRHVAQLSNVPVLGRTALASRIQQVATQTPGAKYPNLIAFLQFWKWLFPYLRDCIHKDASYQTYPVGKSGIFPIDAAPGDGPPRIAVAADWGTGTLEASIVADNMKACTPHYTIHLGDVYYMGETAEISENCLGQPTKNYSGVFWPEGSRGGFALMGNHEMYSGGQGYFQTFLTKLGIFDANKTVVDPQSASYFCLEADKWLVLGLDTGYHSGGVPLFTSIPGVNAVPFLNVDARFDSKMLDWLRETMSKLQAEGRSKKAILVLTHHQPVSSFEHAFKKPAEQLAGLDFLNGQELVWLYGHEHRLTVYQKQTIANTLKAYPRCIGHGGRPVEVTRVTQPNADILYYDPRQHPIDKDDPDTKVGYNGHIVLVFDGPTLTIEYHDILNNALIFTETFTLQSSGELQHTSLSAFGSPLRPGRQPN
jgi:hypothetical protein